MHDPYATFREPEPAPNEFEISHRTIDDRTCVVAVAGDLDLASAPELKWALVELLHQGYGHYVLDLSAVTHMDSMDSASWSPSASACTQTRTWPSPACRRGSTSCSS